MTMELRLIRFEYADVTFGILFLDGVSRCCTLEDRWRPPGSAKVPGKTCIPAGRYQIKPRHEGGMIEKYRRRFVWHAGMLHLQGVPGFKYIYIHVGNFETDTAGCILVGEDASLKANALLNSARVYGGLYREVYGAADQGELFITIEDRK